MLVLFFSQTKLSGQVLTHWTSHGMRHELLSSPDFHTHLPTQFSEQSASLINACSSRVVLISFDETLSLISF